MSERPSSKVPIPGSDNWFRVITTHGNVFYAQKGTRKSSWTIPDEIREQVETLDGRKKRRIEQPNETISQLAAEPEHELEIEPDNKYNGDKQETIDPEVDATLAFAAESAQRVYAEGGPIEYGEEEEEEDPTQNTAMFVPQTTNLSLEEGKAMFMSMLSSLNGTPNEINPMSPWDRELPKFVHLPMYSALPGTREREDTFNEWCKLRLRERREAKRNHSSATAVSSASAEDMYKALLRDKVTSTRSKFEDFSSNFSNDPRFSAYATSVPFTKLVQLFDEWITQLTNSKRAKQKFADESFETLLTQRLPPAEKLAPNKKKLSKQQSDDIWLRAKKIDGLVTDPRYDAVGSASRRSVIFHEWINRGIVHAHSRGRDPERALRQREEQVRREQLRVSGKNYAARRNIDTEQRYVTILTSVSDFCQLLIDAVRDPHEPWTDAQARLSLDPRFSTPNDPLLPEDKSEYFANHVAHICDRRRDQLARIFSKHARRSDGSESLDIESGVVVTLVANDPEYENSGVRLFAGTREALDHEYTEWNKWRHKRARDEFKEMLNENAFVDFWGRLRKEREHQENSTVNTNIQPEDEDESENGAKILDMASNVELKEIESVLQVRIY